HSCPPRLLCPGPSRGLDGSRRSAQPVPLHPSRPQAQGVRRTAPPHCRSVRCSLHTHPSARGLFDAVRCMCVFLCVWCIALPLPSTSAAAGAAPCPLSCRRPPSPPARAIPRAPSPSASLAPPSQAYLTKSPTRRLFELLAAKPEPEKTLLSMLVNDLGEPAHK